MLIFCRKWELCSVDRLGNILVTFGGIWNCSGFWFTRRSTMTDIQVYNFQTMEQDVGFKDKHLHLSVWPCLGQRRLNVSALSANHSFEIVPSYLGYFLQVVHPVCEMSKLRYDEKKTSTYHLKCIQFDLSLFPFRNQLTNFSPPISAVIKLWFFDLFISVHCLFIHTNLVHYDVYSIYINIEIYVRCVKSCL